LTPVVDAQTFRTLAGRLPKSARKIAGSDCRCVSSHPFQRGDFVRWWDVAQEPVVKGTILIAGFPSGEERFSLKNMLGGRNWDLRFTGTLERARAALRAFPTAAVLSETGFSGGYSWKDLLGAIQEVVNPPPLIVASRLADERLWAEVLNFGCYDLLARPFDETEVLRVMSMACRFHESQRERLVAQDLPYAEEGVRRAARLS
jgi:hypothetical protein